VESLDHRTHSVPPFEDLPPDSATVRASIPAALLAKAAPSVQPPSAAGADRVTVKPAGGSLRRGAWISTVAASISAVAAIFAWFTVRPAAVVREQVVVIQRESAATPTVVATQPQTAAIAAEPMAPPVPEAPEPEAAETAQAPSTRSAATPDAKVLTRVFGRRQARVQSCFTKHAAQLPSVPPLSVHFDVDESGQVAEAAISPPEVAASALGRCLLDVARSTRFGPLRHSVSFHIPISVEKVSGSPP
jgi:hypothetical protein